MDNQKSITKIISKAIINDHIDRIFEILSNPDTFSDIMRDYVGDLRMIKGTHLAEKGAEFSLKFEFVVPVIFKVLNSSNDESFKKLHFITKTGSAMDCELIHSLYWDSVEKNTLFIKELILKKNYPIIPEGIEKYKKDQIEIIKRIKKILKLRTIGLDQEESIRIDCNIEELWKFVNDLSFFYSILPCKPTNIFCSNNIDEIGSVLKIVANTVEVDLKVIECTNNDNFKEIVLDYISPQNLKQIMKFCFIQIQEGSCMVSFTNKFLEPVYYKYISDLKESKKKGLSELKKTVEKRLYIK